MKSCPYIINVSSENHDFELHIGEIYKLKAAEKFLLQLIETKVNFENYKLAEILLITLKFKGYAKVLNDIIAIEYHNNYFSYLEIINQNKKQQLLINIDCSKSENCLSNHDNLVNIFEMKPNKNKLAIILMPRNVNKEWLTSCNIVGEFI